jgi:hypothetical protein
VQELTRVLLHHVSRAGVAGMIDLDVDPRWRRRGHRQRQGSGDQRWQQPCAREPVSHGKGVRAINWMNTCWIRDDRRRQKRRRRGEMPASVGESSWWTKELMDGSGSFIGMM